MTTLDERIRQLRDQIFAYVTSPYDGRPFEPLTLIESVLRTVHDEATEAAAKKCDALAKEKDALHHVAFEDDRIDEEIEYAIQASAFRAGAAAIRGKP